MKILETPRDAFQGLKRFVPTSRKVEYYNTLLDVGYDIIDIGSFVSSGLIPQFSDTPEVIDQLDISKTKSGLSLLTGSTSGARKATSLDKISYLGFPFSTSETFLRKNINSNFEKGWKTINEIQELCVMSGKQLMVYLAMGFGNPYGDPCSVDIILNWIDKLNSIGLTHISISDIAGDATADMISEVYASISSEFPQITTGIHLHIKKNDWKDKIDAAWKNGCRIFDGAINGMGGCPMTGYELVGNLPTENLVKFAKKNNIWVQIDEVKFKQAKYMLNQIMGSAY